MIILLFISPFTLSTCTENISVPQCMAHHGSGAREEAHLPVPRVTGSQTPVPASNPGTARDLAAATLCSIFGAPGHRPANLGLAAGHHVGLGLHSSCPSCSWSGSRSEHQDLVGHLPSLPPRPGLKTLVHRGLRSSSGSSIRKPMLCTSDPPTGWSLNNSFVTVPGEGLKLGSVARPAVLLSSSPPLRL